MNCDEKDFCGFVFDEDLPEEIKKIIQDKLKEESENEEEK